MASRVQRASSPADSDTPMITTVNSILSERLKIKEPDVFKGDRKKLRAYLTQCKLYIKFRQELFNSEPEQTLWACTYLRDAAYEWAERFMNDYLEYPGGNQEDERDDETNAVLGTWDGFERRISQVFGDIDEERSAERHLSSLRQRESVGLYAAEFQQYCGRVSWNDAAQMKQFYDGLKENVKDEVSKLDRTNLLDMIGKALKVDNRLRERAIERKEQGRNWYPKKDKRTSAWPQPMELDSTTEPRRQPRKKNNNNRRSGQSKD